MGSYNRRLAARIPLQMLLNEYIKDEPHRALSFNVSEEGIFVNRLRLKEVARESPVVGLEFELPGTSETVWARGEVIFDQTDEFFQSTGIRFSGMAQRHQRLVRDFVLEHQARQLRDILTRIRRNRRLPPTWN